MTTWIWLVPLAWGAPRTLDWAGRTWEVKQGYGGPGPNLWSSSTGSAWVDADGALHLAVRKVGARWVSAELYTVDCATYGTYRFYLDSALDTLDPNVVVAAFLYADDVHEIDIEFSRWGDSRNPDNGQYVVQPPTRLTYEAFPVVLSGTFTTHSFAWSSGLVDFLSVHGHHAVPPSPSHVIHSDRMMGVAIPVEDDLLRVHLNAWLMNGWAPTDGAEAEVVFTQADLPAGRACK